MSAAYISVFMMLLILFIVLRNQKAIIAAKAMKKRKTEDKSKMIELAKRFIGKDCIIYAFDSSHQYEGVIREVSNGAILIEKNGKPEAINLDFVIRIREYPKSKNGKRKSIVLD